jgi:hypothetical protein
MQVIPGWGDGVRPDSLDQACAQTTRVGRVKQEVGFFVAQYFAVIFLGRLWISGQSGEKGRIQGTF